MAAKRKRGRPKIPESELAKALQIWEDTGNIHEALRKTCVGSRVLYYYKKRKRAEQERQNNFEHLLTLDDLRISNAEADKADQSSDTSTHPKATISEAEVNACREKFLQKLNEVFQYEGDIEDDFEEDEDDKHNEDDWY